MNPVRPAFDDGRSLVLQRVRFDDGQLYNIRIRRLDERGEEIPVDAGTPFSEQTLGRVQEIVKEIFQRVPSEATICYRSRPESCISFNPDARVPEVDLTSESYEYLGVVPMAREIHHLLMPELRAEIGSSLVHPKYSPPAPPPSRSFVPPFSAPPSPPPSPPKAAASEKLMREIDEAVRDYRKSVGFLKNITYPQLAEYARLDEKPMNDSLAHAYQIFTEVVKNPQNCTAGEHQEMKEWIIRMYKGYYQKIHEDPQHRARYDHLEEQEEDFEAWCRRHAAMAVVEFIFVPKTAILPLVTELQNK